MSGDSIEDRQNYEFEVLQAIYAQDLKDRRQKAAWNKWQPLDIVLALRPFHDSNEGVNHVKLDLHVICSRMYPDEVPKITLENSCGLSNIKIKDLEKQLHGKAADLVGEVMVYELATLVVDYLRDNNFPPSKSCYDDMISRQKQIKQQEEEAQMKKQELENEEFLKELNLRQGILLEEKKMIKRISLGSDMSGKSCGRQSISSNQWNSSDESSDEMICSHKKMEEVEFTNNVQKTLYRGQCISHLMPNCTLYTAMERDTGQLFSIIEWEVEVKTDETTNKQVSSFEQEFSYLTKLKHENLIRYWDITYKTFPSENKIVIYLLQEHIIGTNLSGLFVYKGISVEMDLLRYIAEGVLNALEFLHRNKLKHKDLNSNCVYINDKGTIKVSNYSIGKRISDFASKIHSLECNKKSDIYNFGVLILSLVKGIDINHDNIQVDCNLSEALQDFIHKCFVENEKDRYSANQLLNHSFIKHPVSKLLPDKVTNENFIENDNSAGLHNDLHIFAPPQSQGRSRVENEFQKLEHLGKGAYGDVFKVKNRLDQRFYALKRIQLDPKNKQANKKIIREVTLLSRLNHENVVRYYNSWIETANLENKANLDTSEEESEVTDLKIAPDIKGIEWSISYGHGKVENNNSISSSSSQDSSDDDDDDCNWMDHLEIDDSLSDSIEFDRGEDEFEYSMDMQESTDLVRDINKEIKVMYIQMEFCEKSTLRTAIDDGLYLEKDRLWRLFREIVEGLSHIHQQGMIHRDLKPMNIFLDSNDHVKIGDFGLATTNLLSKPNDAFTISKSYYEDRSHDGGGDPSMTGHVGTALYVAPELAASAKVGYNKKVDIYSLGVIFFEMCYKPMNTGMERISVLNSLRSEEILLPVDFLEKGTENQEKIIRWLLNHRYQKRPTSLELLQSDYVPPPVLEECRLRELVRHTLSNTQLKGYKYLVESCFKQPVTAAQDLTYDNDNSTPNIILKHLQMYNHIKEVVTKVFQIHGGQQLSTPLLMPKSSYYERNESCVKLMTHSGSIVSIPHDLRVPFARYVAWNGVTSLRRYSIERVYREKRIFGFIPRELYECAFDIVSSSQGNLMEDAELLSILNEIVNAIPALNNKKLLIRINHTVLLKALLLNCGIKEKHSEIFTMLTDAKEGKTSKWQIKRHLFSKGLSESAVNVLFNILDAEYEDCDDLQNVFKKVNSEASQCARQALHELKTIIKYAKVLGVVFPLMICPGLVYNIHQYSGMMCQLVYDVKRKHKFGRDVIAAGGRYDNMINSYRFMMVQANMLNKDIKQYAVGISISLDKLVQATIQKEQILDTKLTNLDVVVCSLGSKDILAEKTRVLRDLWQAGIRSTLIESSSLEDVQQQCSELNVSVAILLKDAEHGYARLHSFDKESFQFQNFLQKIPLCDLVDTVHRMKRTLSETASEPNYTPNTVLRTDSKMTHSEHSYDVKVTIFFIYASEKLSVNSRKRLENNIRSNMDSVFQRLNGEVCLLALSIESSVINTLASCLSFNSEHEFNKSIEVVKERHQKIKKGFNEISEQIYKQKRKRSNAILILYSLLDNMYKVLL